MAILQMNALQLRALADTASSWRARGGDPMFGVIAEQDGTAVLDIQPTLTEPLGSAVEFNTADVQPARPIVTIVTLLEAAGAEAVNDYDAIFWSEAAVEKFVFPYYASKSLWSAAWVLQNLATLWYGFVPGAPAVASTEPIPFAIAHLPGSDYVGLTEDGPVTGGEDLHLLSIKDGALHKLSFNEYLSRQL